MEYTTKPIISTEVTVKFDNGNKMKLTFMFPEDAITENLILYAIAERIYCVKWYAASAAWDVYKSADNGCMSRMFSIPDEQMPTAISEMFRHNTEDPDACVLLAQHLTKGKGGTHVK